MEGHPQTHGNVINIHTRKTVLPQKVRATLMGQYTESKANDHTAEQFVEYLEKRVLGDMAYEATKLFKDAIEELFSGTRR